MEGCGREKTFQVAQEYLCSERVGDIVWHILKECMVRHCKSTGYNR